MVRPAHRARRLLQPGVLEITQSLPGRRFQERYRRMRAQKGGVWKRCLFVCGGIALCLAGVVFLAIPGPGLLIIALGLAMIAQESAALARLLDRAEVKLRRLWKRFRNRGRSPNS